MMMKTFFTASMVCLSLVGVSAAFAHGDAKPKHGGMVQTANDLSFELVVKGDDALLYLEDHDKPLAAAGISGKLTVLKGGEKSEAELKPAGAWLEAKGVKLTTGAKVVAVLTTANRKVVTVRFTVK